MALYIVVVSTCIKFFYSEIPDPVRLFCLTMLSEYKEYKQPLISIAFIYALDCLSAKFRNT